MKDNFPPFDGPLSSGWAPEHTHLPAGLPTPARAAGLIRQLHEGEVDPVDELLDALAAGETAARILDSWSFSSAWPASGWRAAAVGDLKAGTLENARQAAKRAYDPERPGPDRHAAMLVYLLAVAAGQVYHDRFLSTLPVETVQDWLTAVGDAVESPLSGLFAEAASRFSS